MQKITVLGSRGFVGSHLLAELQKRGIFCDAPAKKEDLSGQHLGHVLDAAGITADYRSRFLETAEAHVCRIVKILRECRFDSFTYLSSSRVYQHQKEKAQENSGLLVNPQDDEDFYNLSKLMGEAVLLSSGQKVKIVRISNIYGSDLSSRSFLSAVLQDAVTGKKIVLSSSLDSEKDYIAIDEAVGLILKIALEGRETLYNVGAGENTAHRDIIRKIRELTGCSVEVSPSAASAVFPVLCIEKIRKEFGFQARGLLKDLPGLVGAYREALKAGQYGN